MRDGPLVSAIIPTYNREHVVCEAVDSVLGQTYPHIEVIVVDDGSSDGTSAVLRAYGDRIRTIVQSNTGPSGARNRGIAASEGEIIAFLDSDDLWLPTKIERQVAIFSGARTYLPCCLCNVRMLWHDRERSSFEIAGLAPPLEEGIWCNPDEVLATRFVLTNQAVAIRRDVLERAGGFEEGLRLLEDYELSLRLSLEGPWGFIRDPLVVWRESTTGSLYQESRHDEVRLRSLETDILERHAIRVRQENRHTALAACVEREVRGARRQLRAVKLIEQGSVRTFAGHVLQGFERCRSALDRRLPWFPRMDVRSLDHVGPVQRPEQPSCSGASAKQFGKTR